MQVSNQLYVYIWNDPRENNCNSIFIDGKTPVLIDPGHRNRVDTLLQRMQSDGIEKEQVKVIINTHAHPDHFEGNQLFDPSMTKIAMSREEERFLEETGRPMLAQQGMQMPEYRVDFYLKEGTLSLGRHEFEIFLTPGHSPGSLCIYWPRHRVLITGDLVFAQGVGRADLPGGDPDALKESVNRIAQLPVDLLIPGHGPPVQGEDRIKANYQYIKRMFFNAL